MSTQEGIGLGLRAAATLLECTAEDFEEKAKRKEAHLPPAGPLEDPRRDKGLAEVRHLREQATLLRCQAEEVRELKVARGR